MIDLEALTERVKKKRDEQILKYIEDGVTVKQFNVKIVFNNDQQEELIFMNMSSEGIESIIVNTLEAEDYEDMDKMLYYLKKNLFAEKYSLFLGKIIKRKDGKICRIRNWTSNSVEIFITKSSDKGIDYFNWYDENNFIKQFNI